MANRDQAPRQLIVCCDGTDNTLTGNVHDTNVLQLFTELNRSPSSGRVTYYDPGVGSPDQLPSTDVVQLWRRKWDRIAGLASGQGIFENIAQAYLFLMREWRDGDQVWLFGFSRGAFTARSVAGMVHLFGVLRPEHEVMLPTLLRVYFSCGDDEASPAMRALNRIGIGKAQRKRGDIARQVRGDFCDPAGRDARVHFVGVWDTVESVGLPGFGLRISSQATIQNKRIRHVRHALSLDEHRRPFQPRLFIDQDFGGPADEQSMRQRWFRGAHSDVGGGYEADASGLANAALDWMIEQAIECGLGCRPATQWVGRGSARLAHDPVYDTPWWAVMGMTVRTTDPMVGERKKAVRLVPVAHASVIADGPTSVWNHRRPARPLVVALTIGAVALVGSGYMLMPGSGWAAFGRFLIEPASWLRAAGLAKDLGLTQANAWFDAAGSFQVASAVGACPRMALLWDLLFISCYAYVLARLCGRAFVHYVGWREVGNGGPRGTTCLGASLPFLVAGDLVEDMLGGIGFTFGRDSIFGPGSFCVGVFGALVKYAGLAGCCLLLLLGYRARDRRRAQAPK